MSMIEGGIAAAFEKQEAIKATLTCVYFLAHEEIEIPHTTKYNPLMNLLSVSLRTASFGSTKQGRQCQLH